MKFDILSNNEETPITIAAPIRRRKNNFGLFTIINIRMIAEAMVPLIFTLA